MQSTVKLNDSQLRKIIAESVKKVLTEQLKRRIDEMTAYHGSPFNFKVFGEKYINTIYGGWGTYLTSDIEVGKFYACGNSNSGGYLYEVEIPNDNGTNYLHLNAKSEEYRMVYSILIKEFPEYETALRKALEICKENGSFDNILKGVGPIKPKEISKAFDKNGIIGLNSNPYSDTYVIFNKKNIKILKKTFLRNRWN